MTDRPLVPGPVYGLRTWLVGGSPGAERLVGVHARTPWPEGGAELVAVCTVTAAHVPPVPGCTCGLYAWHPSRAAARRVCGVRGEIPGILEATGALEIHDDGFRAARGRPHALVALPGRNLALIERLAAAYDAEVLRLRRPDDLADHCAEHGLGLTPAVVEQLVGRDRVERGRRDRRRRALAAGLKVAALVLALAAIGAVAHGHTEHGKILHGRAGEVRVP